MKTDRELIEKAAMAMGVAVSDWVEMFPGEWYAELDVPREKNNPPTLWSPLTDDCDAFRLAAALEIDVMFRRSPVARVEVSAAGGRLFCQQFSNLKDRRPAARRAITRAAAAIEEAKEGV